MNGFGHIEIPTTSIKKAKKFFGKVFEWTFTDHKEIGYTIIHTGVHPNGGLERVKKMPKRSQVNVYIEVQDLKAKLKEIKKAGGKVTRKPKDVPGMGQFARFRTPDGCSLYLWESVDKGPKDVKTKS